MRFGACGRHLIAYMRSANHREFYQNARWHPSYPFFSSFNTPQGMRFTSRSLSYLTLINQVYRSKLIRDTYKNFRHRSRKINYHIQPSFEFLGGLPVFNRIRSKLNRDGGPIKTSKVCQFYGFLPDYVGFRDPKPIQRDESLVSFIYQNKHMFSRDEVNSLLTDRQVWEGGYASAYNILNEFAIENPSQYTAERLLENAESCGFLGQVLPKMDALSINDLNLIRVNLDAYSGHYMSKLYGTPNKNSVIPASLIARRLYERITSGPYKSTMLWSLSGRSKDIKLWPTDPSAKPMTRIIHMCEAPLVHLSSIIVQPFTRAMQNIYNSPIILGRGYSHNEITEMVSKESFFEFVVNTDWPHFDTFLKPDFILAAMEILRQCYPSDRKTTRFFAFLYDTIVDRLVIVPPGFIYRFRQGMPSGHPLVSIVNTLVNLLLWISIASEVYGQRNIKENFFVYGSGDDAKVFFRPHRNLYNIDDIIKRVSGVSGDSVLDTLKHISCGAAFRTYISALFLKRRIYFGNIVGWDTIKTIRKLIYRDKYEPSLTALCSWARDQLLTAPGNPNFNNFILRYVAHRVKQEYGLKVDVSEVDIRPDFNFIGLSPDESRLRLWLLPLQQAIRVGSGYFLLGRYDFKQINLSNDSKAYAVDESLLRSYRAKTTPIRKLVAAAAEGSFLDLELFDVILGDMRYINFDSRDRFIKELSFLWGEGRHASATPSFTRIGRDVNFIRLCKVLHHIFKFDLSFLPSRLLQLDSGDIGFLKLYLELVLPTGAARYLSSKEELIVLDAITKFSLASETDQSQVCSALRRVIDKRLSVSRRGVPP